MSEFLIRQMLVDAVNNGNEELISRIVAQIAASERAHGTLRAKGYGATGMPIDMTAREVPNATY